MNDKTKGETQKVPEVSVEARSTSEAVDTTLQGLLNQQERALDDNRFTEADRLEKLIQKRKRNLKFMETGRFDEAPKMYAWKRLSDGVIYEDAHADSKDELFEMFGFGAVEVDKPIKGFLAVEVKMVGGHMVEVEPSASASATSASTNRSS